jgi:hypothetical protein
VFSHKFTVTHLVIDNTNVSEFLTCKKLESRVPLIGIHICLVSEIHLETDLPTDGCILYTSAAFLVS